jgi:hypothetical protein
VSTRRLGGIVAAAAIACTALYGSTGVAAAATVAKPKVSVVPLAMREGNGEQLLHLRLDAPAAVTKSLTYTLDRGTARPGSDFLTSHGTVTFLAGAVDAWTDPITPVNDALYEDAEWIRIRFSSVSLDVPQMSRVTILDDDWPGHPTVTPSTDLVDGQLVRIQASGLSPGLTIWPHECESSCVIGFPPAVVDRHGRLDTAIRIRRFFNDYGGDPYDCVFASGCSIKLHLENAEDGQTIGNRTPLSFRRIVPEPTISIPNLRVVEGSRTDGGWTSSALTVTLDHVTDGPVAFSVKSVDGTAGPNDFYFQSRYETIAAGEISFTLPLVITADSDSESDETFAVELVYAGGAHIAAPGRGYVTIVDDD